ncbi:MAG: Xaa-Pro peptidase family protein [Erysipelotrichaceae bacterium]|nr:Xaa-Pro peptidase family protein [Erysipelotrichaceae bacterium]
MKESRIIKAKEIMKDQNIDGMLYAQSANFQYLLDCKDFYWQRACDTNIMGRSSAFNMPCALLYLSSNGECTIIANHENYDYFKKNYPDNTVYSYMDQFEDAISPYIKGKRIAVGYPCFDYLSNMLKEIDKDIEVVDGEDLLKDVRCYKDADEIEELRKICKFTDDAVMYVVNNLKEGMTQREAENLLVEYGYKNGIQDLSFPPTIGFKTQNTITTQVYALYDRNWKLVPQTGIACDVGFMNNGYCSDWGRSFYYGKAPEICKKGYKALNDAILYMVDNIVPYKTNINELYQMVADKVEELGFIENLRYRDIQMLGHQIGIDCHEFPLVNKDNDFIIKPGMTFAVEPKMWFENEMYMRVEDIVLITETGAEILTNFPRDLFEIDVNH